MSTFLELQAGEEVLATTVVLDRHWLAEYRAAVGGASGADTVPPLALVALGMRLIFGEIELPSGTVHTTQSFRAHGSAYPGESLQVRWVASRAARRQGSLFVNLDLSISRAEESLLEARVGLIVLGVTA